MADKKYFQDANLFNRLPPAWYLNRTHHTGQQAISTIIGLQEAIDACSGIFATRVYVNSQDASYLIVANAYADFRDSLVVNYVNQQDTSLFNYVYDNHFLKEVSLGSDFVWSGGLLDVSINAMDYAYVDGSLARFIRSASTGSGLYWNAGVFDVSVEGKNYDASILNLYTYVDGSLLARDTSINWLNFNKINNASLGLYYAKTQIDASFALITSVLWDVSTDTTTVFLKDPSDNLELSYIELQENGGTLLFTDMPISSVTIGSEQSYSMNIDGSAAFRVFGIGASTALRETAVVVDANYFAIGNPQTNGSWRFIVDTSGNLSVQKRITGSWLEKGNFN